MNRSHALIAAVVSTVVIVVVSVVAVASPSDHSDSHVRDTALSNIGPAEHVTPNEQSRHYVALGSSYAAGLDSPELTSSRCLRNSDDYPHQVAAAEQMTLTDVTCSASTIPDILYRAQPGRASVPQIDAVTADTDLVTITTGGNDIQYIGRLTAISCANWLSQPGHGDSHHCRPGRPRRPPTATDFAALDNGLVNVVDAVRARAPHAQVIIVDYLPVLDQAATTCPAVPLTPSEAVSTVDTFNGLTDATRAAAEATGATLVDAASAGADHTACSPSPWVYGFRMPAPYHPNAEGRAAMARLTIDAVAAPSVDSSTTRSERP